jgi:N-acetyl-1-D-myo-inositol-2-amino-2-deoxy-alpha-D-glucopyranoside deacetylase
MATLLLVHAHPDDEAISTGGVMMKAKAHGHRVVLITATRGEVGEIYNMDEAQARPRLGEIRTRELKAADEILGVDRQEFLGYRDSGMVDTADNKNARSFHQAPLDEAASKLAVFVREERPAVVVTYAEDGVYGHPDHVKAHHVTNAALDLLEREGTPVRKLYYTAIPRSMMEAFVEQMPEDARRAMSGNMRIAGTPDELVTTKVDVHDYVERKRDAFRAHVSQNDPKSFFSTMQDQVYELAFGTEYYQLARGKPGSELPEPDLFSGIDQGLPT